MLVSSACFAQHYEVGGAIGYGVYALNDEGESQYVFMDGQGSRVRQMQDQGATPLAPIGLVSARNLMAVLDRARS